jgi:signal transduction histidine kinase
VLRVSDTGHGMDELTRQKIFEPFFTTREAGQGTGLGLSVVHGMVQSLGGAVTVDSAPAAGAVFRVFFQSAG